MSQEANVLYFNITDKLTRHFPGRDSLVASMGYNNFNIWKVRLTSSYVAHFIQILGSAYIVGISLEGDRVFGIWDIADARGFIFHTKVEISGNIVYGDEIVRVLPDSKLSMGNSDIFDLDTRSDRLKQIEFEARQILHKMIVSPEHRNKDPVELAVKAIKIAEEFQTQFKSFSSLYNDQDG